MTYYVYFLTNYSNSTLYVGVTNDIGRRYQEHLSGKGSRFVKKYKLYKLVRVEIFSEPYLAISREKEIKGWRRSKKNELVSEHNPQWRNLRDEI